MKKTMAAALLAGALSMSQAVSAAGTSGVLVLDSVDVQGDYIYLRSPSFLNPDGCSDHDVVRLFGTPAELDRMLAVALTSIATGKPVFMWFNGCGSTAWSASSPLAVTIAIAK